MTSPLWLLRAALAVGAVRSHLVLPSECDDLPWSDQDMHRPGGNGTKQTAFSWHIHYLYGYRNSTPQDEDVEAFGENFCKDFAHYGKSGTCVDRCEHGPDYIGQDQDYICSAEGQCNCPGNAQLLEKKPFHHHTCTNGTCDTAFGPWPMCQKSFHVAESLIDVVTAWIAQPANHRSLTVMRHPNTGCQWGDHSARSEYFGFAAPEICLWHLPCNGPGQGCGSHHRCSNDGTRGHQHSEFCFQQVSPPPLV